MADSTYNEKVIKGILHAMSITAKDVKDDFASSISRSNDNGLYSAVWARRSDDLENQFHPYSEITVFHIKRTTLWQIDPVFDRNTGILYLLFSDTNLEQVRKKFIRTGKSNHYSVSFLLKNIGLLPMETEQTELFSLTTEEILAANMRKQQDIEKMLGKDAEFVNKIVIVNVAYHEDEAIAALFQEYTDGFELSSQMDVSHMLDPQYYGDSSMDDDATEPIEFNQPLVKLKDIKKIEGN